MTSGGPRISPRWEGQPFRGPPTYDFAKVSQKLHEIERIWTPGGERTSLGAMEQLGWHTLSWRNESAINRKTVSQRTKKFTLTSQQHPAGTSKISNKCDTIRSFSLGFIMVFHEIIIFCDNHRFSCMKMYYHSHFPIANGLNHVIFRKVCEHHSHSYLNMKNTKTVRITLV